jgi:NitT/TauT family transport system substrate-binding protein
MAKTGLLRKWGDKYGVQIKTQRFDYAPSVDAFTSKNVDACTMTNMEALDLPAASGVDTTVIIIGDYSNGNDALITRGVKSVRELSGKKVMLVQKTVSEYLLERAFVLNKADSDLRKVKLVNASDSSIVAAFMNDSSQAGVVTWKPLVSQLQSAKGYTTIFDSSKVPGEILDLLVVRTEVLKRSDGSGARFAKAITGAWYEMMAQMSGANADNVLTAVAGVSEDTLKSYKEQLSTTHMLYKPAEAAAMATSPGLKEKMELVRQFCFTHGLLGGIKSADEVALRYPDASVQGKADRVRLRFDATYMQLAEKAKL